VCVLLSNLLSRRGERVQAKENGKKLLATSPVAAASTRSIVCAFGLFSERPQRLFSTTADIGVVCMVSFSCASLVSSAAQTRSESDSGNWRTVTKNKLRSVSLNAAYVCVADVIPSYTC
jgi:hypothetical protein